MDEPLKPSDRYRRMAEQIDHNAAGSFGGAIVIVPPQNLTPIEVLSLDTQEDAAQFFMLLQAKIQTILAQIEEQQRRGVTFGR